MDHQQVSHDANEFASSTRGYGHARCSRGVCPHRGRRWGADCVGDTRGRCIGHAPRDHSADLGFDLGSMVGCSAIVVDAEVDVCGERFRGPWPLAHSLVPSDAPPRGGARGARLAIRVAPVPWASLLCADKGRLHIECAGRTGCRPDEFRAAPRG